VSSRWLSCLHNVDSVLYLIEKAFEEKSEHEAVQIYVVFKHKAHADAPVADQNVFDAGKGQVVVVDAERYSLLRCFGREHNSRVTEKRISQSGAQELLLQ